MNVPFLIKFMQLQFPGNFFLHSRTWSGQFCQWYRQSTAVADLVVHPSRNNFCSSDGYACHSLHFFFCCFSTIWNLADSSFTLRLGKCSHRLEVEQDRVWDRLCSLLCPLPVTGSRGSPVAAAATQPNRQLSVGWDVVTALGGSSSNGLSQLFYSRLFPL